MKIALVANSADFAVKHRRNFFLNLKSEEFDFFIKNMQNSNLSVS